MDGDIAVGSIVQYTGTGTIGEVKRIEERDRDIWACVDSTGLWYNTETLEVVRYVVERDGLTIEEPKRAKKPRVYRSVRFREMREAVQYEVFCADPVPP
ncbi:MAG TPA: DUF2098 domain-containing protein [Methanosarcinales archaeon]|nr:DUF2098 domain-containing protein [Methanosarcinales archaeon]